MTTEHNIASAKYTLQHYCSVSALYCIQYVRFIRIRNQPKI